MKTALTIQEIGTIVSDFIQVGFMEAVKSYEPSKDTIRENELIGWCKMLGIDKKRIKALVEAGIIHKKRNGEGKNSPIIYSKKEIKCAIATAKLNGIIKSNMI